MTEGEACGCSGEHEALLCPSCGRFEFHFVFSRGPTVISVVAACPYCDYMDEWPAVQADDEAWNAVERSLAAGSVLMPRFWDPVILN